MEEEVLVVSTRYNRIARATLLLVIAVGVAVRAEAQGVASSLDELRHVVNVGDDVVVTDLQGRQTRGSIAEVSPASLGLIVDGVRIDFAEHDLATIGRRDSRWNGTLWGLGVGGALGAWLDRGLVHEYGREDISRGDSAAFIIEAAAVGAGLGFTIDAMVRGTRVIYARPQPSMGLDTMLLPVWANSRKGLFVSLRF